MSHRPCKFFNTPSGCHKGSRCNFLHKDAGTNVHRSSPTPSATQGRSSPIGQRGNSSSGTSTARTPPGACNFFWTSGTCKREFGCRFRHVQSSPSDPTEHRTRGNHDMSLDTIAPFLTADGLARVTGTGTDVYFSPDSSKDLSPTHAHNALKRFLVDDYRFSTTLEIYAFLKPLSSAHTANTSWSSEDGQLLLSTCCAKDNGLLRISDILGWSPVSIKAGSNRQMLSFQRGYLPLLRYLSSEFVVKSTLSHLVNALYMRVMENLDHFADVVEESMQAIMAAKSFRDIQSSASKEPIGSQVLASLAAVFFECLTRFKNSVVIYPRLASLVRNLQGWVQIWIEGISAIPPAFDDPFKSATAAARDHITSHLTGKVDRLIAIVDREQAKTNRSLQHDRFTTIFAAHPGSNEGIIAALHTSYDGPGAARRDGPRHDNDYLDIAEIRIAPTHEELISRIPPFLPANLHDAPHPLPPESMERLLDIQFRLLREELTAPLRTSVQLVREDLRAPSRTKTRLLDIIDKRGGKYRGFTDGQESVMFNVYTNLTFTPFVPDWRGISVGITFDAPPGRARSPQPKARAAFWEGMSGKRLMQGGLVALVWRNSGEVAVHLGILASSLREVSESSKRDEERVAVRVAFFDPRVELRILQSFKHSRHETGTKVLVEAPVMFEAIRPFLEALRVEPETIPFGRCLVHRPLRYFESFQVEPPAYASVPGFSYKLSSLFPPDAGVQDLRMSVTDPASIDQARQELRMASRLDPSQADAVVDTLLRQVSLIQGPPGTGKSFTGVELLRVLLANNVGPVLMIAFTNHALDHMLSSVLDSKMTQKIVRLGSRSADERISQFSIENMEMVQGKSRLDRTFGHHHRALKDVEEEVKELMIDFLKVKIESGRIIQFLELHYPEFHEHLINPPAWISTIKSINSHDSDEEWKQVGRHGRGEDIDNSMYAHWRSGQDLTFIETLGRQILPSIPDTVHSDGQSRGNMFSILDHHEATSQHNEDVVVLEDDESDISDEDVAEERWTKISLDENLQTPVVPAQDSFLGDIYLPPQHVQASAPPHFIQPSDLRDPPEFFIAHGCDHIPVVPTSDRTLDELFESADIWSMSRSERHSLHGFWIELVRTNLHENQLQEFERLRQKHADKLRTFNEGKDEARRQLLQNVDIIGCTTTGMYAHIFPPFAVALKHRANNASGAAKLTSLLKGVSPRIMLVEEAGQVLEAHVLGSLVPSVQHLILIGDPLQLRPTLNNYSLSMDSRRGSELFKFDMSLMERLAKSGFPMSQIDVQRRMRPTISNLIRNTLYPKLEDHDLVKQYPPVRGFAKDVFFLSHSHRENGGAEEMTSKYNTYEVDMIKDLVMYLLRQGCYSQEGDIVVLCAYLGQLAKVRDALASEVAVIIDDRDQMALADQETENEDISEPGTGVEHVQVAKRVRLRTVDNYQGEEAKIVILSLVRNSGASDDVEATGFVSSGRANIGFLKSENRTNVALSRAREGLFILGNALNLASRSHMWSSVIEELEQNDAVGEAFPVVCQRHPDIIEYVSEPGKLPRLAPDGGCLMSCDTRLKCGHLCPYKCHPDDPNHIAVTCVQTCRRLCIRGHPCDKQCAVSCGECQFPIADVNLPCGHRKAVVPCHSMDSLSEVSCDEVVTKALPNCEHHAQMMCSQDAAQYRCEAPCGSVMTSCCGRDCHSRCSECQQVNNKVADGPIPRQFHRQHACEKPLYCEHLCANPCSPDHQCTTRCKRACRQVCSHARCRQPCSAPCAPCQEPCTWRCSHFICPVPCGSVCARLPCDKRCDKQLRCGHSCPSVCGENCSIQICPICAPEQVKEAVVDVVMYRKLGEIDLEQETLDEILITLPGCRHVFTVETLDGICDMKEFYRRDDPDGRWVGFADPPTGFRKPPTCPTCRTAITSPRYGRIFKRADLDILENNVASQMSNSLRDVRELIGLLSKADMEIRVTTEAGRVKANSASLPKKKLTSRKKAQNSFSKESREIPAPLDALDPSNNKLHSVTLPFAQAWRKATNQLFNAYAQALRIAETRSAHINAWEAAFSYLYEQEVGASLEDPAHAPRRPQEHAMRIARIKVGQPRPQADKRFIVEAFWLTLDLRFTLASLGQMWLEAAGSSGVSYGPQQRQAWAFYIRFILHTCCQDAQIAFNIADRSGSHRQAVSTHLYCMRAELERFRFNIHMARQSETFTEDREELAENAAQNGREAERESLRIAENYFKAKGSRQDEKWLENNFTQIAHAIVEEWSNLERSLCHDTFYQPVSMEEQMAVVRALSANRDFAHTGHYYRCPNGHLYVIGDCGGATERTQCPECGETIGGSGHTLDATNSRAMDFENLAQQQGAQRSPWRWGV